jgi:Flp pilus assembly protein TadD
MDGQIFISYARRSAAPFAQALHAALGDRSFLDETEIADGAEIPKALLDGLLASNVFVAFVDDTYFTRRYCVQEFAVALGAFQSVTSRSGSEREQRETLDPVVIALPVGGVHPQELNRLPPLLRNSSWPRADDTKSLASLSAERAKRVSRTLGDRMRALGVREAVIESMRAAVEVPYPRNTAGLRCYPLELRPSLGRGLVDRANELWSIHTSLTTHRVDTSAAALTGSLEGGGGFGKTRLAIEYLHRYGRDSFPGGLFWIDADVSAERLEQQLVEVLEVLNGESVDLVAFREAGRNARTELAHALHAQPAEKPLLYVVDNVPEPGRNESPKDLSTWCPAIGKVALLVTSRASQSLTGSVDAITVDVLPLGPAVSLLTQDFPGRSAVDEKEWEQIAEWVGRLPLALVLLSAALRAGAVTPKELGAIAADERPAAELDRQMAALTGLVKPGNLRGIAEAFKTSYQRLPPKARRAARVLAQLSPEPIPIAILEALGKDVAEPATRSALVSRSFVSAVPEAEVPMLGRMHRVLADYLRSFAPDDDSDIRLVRKALNDLFGGVDVEDPRKSTQLDALLPHAEWVFADVSRSQDAELVDVEMVVELGLHIGGLLSARGLAGGARSIYEKVVQLAVDRLGEEHPGTLASMNNLAVTLRAQGDLLGARELLEQTLEVRRRVFGEEHADTLSCMADLASTLRAQGDLQGARELQEQTLQVERRTLGEEHPSTLTSMNNLAVTLRAQGDLRGARELQEQTLEAHRRILGEEHAGTLSSMNNLAGTVRAQGDLPRAKELLQQTLEARRRTLGEEHPDTLTSMNNLASALGAQGDLPGARELQEQTLEVQRRTLGEEHPNTLVSMNNLARTLWAERDLPGARELLERTIEARRRILGEEHPDTLTSMHNLAITLRDQGDLPGARELQEQTLEARRRILGEEHPDTLTSINNLAIILRDQGDLPGARELQEQTLDARRRVLGEEHSHTLISMNDLAQTFGDQGDLAAANDLRERVLKVQRRARGKSN